MTSELRWYHEDGRPHLCDTEACEAVANSMFVLSTRSDTVVFHYCDSHAEEVLIELGEHALPHFDMFSLPD